MSKINRDPDPLDRLITVEKFMRDAENGTVALRPDPRFLKGLGGGGGTIETFDIDIGDGPTEGGILFGLGDVEGYEGLTIQVFWITIGFFKFRYNATWEGPSTLSSPGAIVSPVSGPDQYRFEVRVEGTAFDKLKELQTALGYSNLLLPFYAAAPGASYVTDNMTSAEDSGQTGYFSTDTGSNPLEPQLALFYNDGADYFQGNIDYWLLSVT